LITRLAPQPQSGGTMVDFPYRPKDVDDEVRPIFEQLRGEFGMGFEIWRGVDNFGQWKSAGVRNVASRSAVRVRVKTGTNSRPTPLSPEEMGRIRDHLTSGNEQILEL
jgi:hypothetical protein